MSDEQYCLYSPLTDRYMGWGALVDGFDPTPPYNPNANPEYFGSSVTNNAVRFLTEEDVKRLEDYEFKGEEEYPPYSTRSIESHNKDFICEMLQYAEDWWVVPVYIDTNTMWEEADFIRAVELVYDARVNWGV